MIKRDLLDELYKGLISVDESYAILESILESPEAPSVKEALGFSDPEYTAYGHGVGLINIAKWRHEGWPEACAKCRKSLVVGEYGWWAKKEDNVGVLYHIGCL